MVLIDELAELGIDERFVDLWKRRGINSLTQVQEKAFRNANIFGGKNVIVLGPSSSGKTFIGEVVAVDAARRIKKAIYLVPLKAIAEEKYREFRNAYEPLGLSVVVSSGDYSEFDDDIRAGGFDLAVIVYEKFGQLLVQVPGLLSICGLIIVDEIQMIGAESRGPKLELLLTKVLLTPQRPQIIGLSATVGDLNDLHVWLDADLVVSEERPVPLFEGVCTYDGSVSYIATSGNFSKTISRHSIEADCTSADDLICQLVGLEAGEGNQILVFCSTKDACQSTAQRLLPVLPTTSIPTEAIDELNLLEDTEAREFLERGLLHKVGYHNADLSVDERLFVEKMFRLGLLQVLVCTSTLTMGVNLPADLVIFRDHTRGAPRQPRQLIPISEYKNAAGRAGRYGISEKGRSLLLARNDFEADQLERTFILAALQIMESAIPRERDVSHHVLNLIVSGLAESKSEIMEVMQSSYAYLIFYRKAGGIAEQVEAALQQCVELELLGKGLDDSLAATNLGQVMAYSGVSLDSFRILKTLVERTDASKHHSLDLLFEVCRCSEIKPLQPWVYPEDWGAGGVRSMAAPLVEEVADTAPLRAVVEGRVISGDEISALKKALVLKAWAEGESAREIERAFKLRLGPMTTLAETVSWLIETFSQLLRVCGFQNEFVAMIQTFADEIKFGGPRETIPVAKLRVAGLSRAKRLRLVNNEKGLQFTSLDQILDASPEEFKGVLEPAQLVNALQAAILKKTGESLGRKRKAHLLRLAKLAPPRELLEQVYDAQGRDFDIGLEALFNSEHLGIPCMRVARQRAGEHDLVLHHKDGSIIVSATSSPDNEKPIRWEKCREVLGQGVGLGPIAYVVIGKPSFHEEAIRQAEMLKQDGTRHLLLITLPILIEACFSVWEGKLSSPELFDILRNERGHLSEARLSELMH